MTAARSLDWGSVPAWVSSLLTGGSLLLGFYILLRDRRKEEWSQAAALSYTMTTVKRAGATSEQLVVSVHNNSSAFIYRAVIFTEARSLVSIRADPVLSEAYDAWMLSQPVGNPLEMCVAFSRVDPYEVDGVEVGSMEIGPGQRTELALMTPLPGACYRFMLQFTDARNVRWVRDLGTGRLRRVRSPLRRKLHVAWRKLTGREHDVFLDI